MKPALAPMRARVTAAMSCTGRLREVVSTETDDDGFLVVTYETRYEGRMLIYPADREARVVEAVGASVPLVRYTALFPAGTDVSTGNVLNVTDSPDNPRLVGPLFRITDAPLDAWEIARHCVAETTG